VQERFAVEKTLQQLLAIRPQYFKFLPVQVAFFRLENFLFEVSIYVKSLFGFKSDLQARFFFQLPKPDETTYTQKVCLERSGELEAGPGSVVKYNHQSLLKNILGIFEGSAISAQHAKKNGEKFAINFSQHMGIVVQNPTNKVKVGVFHSCAQVSKEVFGKCKFVLQSAHAEQKLKKNDCMGSPYVMSGDIPKNALLINWIPGA
jgi:hypothetical protein